MFQAIKLVKMMQKSKMEVKAELLKKA